MPVEYREPEAHTTRHMDIMARQHPIVTNVQDAADHLRVAVESNAGVNKDQLRHEIANVKHYLAFLKQKCSPS